MVVQRLRFFGAICAAGLVVCTFANVEFVSAQNQNRISDSDFSAGQIVDSLFEPNLPLPAARKTSKARQGTRRRAALRGQLVDNPNYREGAPPFALVNREGQVLRYVKPVEEVDVEMYLGETVSVRRDTGRVLLASQLALPKRTPPADAELIAFEEETPAEPTPAEPIPAGDEIEEESIVTSELEPEVTDVEQGPIIYEDGSEEYYGEPIDFGGCSECSDGTCQTCSRGCAMPGRGVMYARGEFLSWWLKGMNTPPLVISRDIPFDEVNPNIGSTTLYGGSPILEDVRYGGRLTFGLWLDECGTWGVEADYLGLGRIDEVFTAGVLDGNDDETDVGVFLHIGRPYFNTAPFLNRDGVEIVRGPAVQLVDTGNLDGTVTVTAKSEFQSAGIRLRHGLCFVPGSCAPDCGSQVGCGSKVGCGTAVGCGACQLEGPFGHLCRLIKYGCRRVDVLYGIRWARLDDSVNIFEDLEELPDNVGTTVQPIATFDVNDYFETKNEFFGGELGFLMEWQRARWSLGVLSKVAIGNTRQRVDIQGSTVIDGGAPEVGGLLTQYYEHPSGFNVGNIGRYARDEFSMIPEIGVTLGYCLTPRFRLTAGYTLLYWSNVVRAGEQIDIDVNGNLIPSNQIDDLTDLVVPGDHPRFEFRQTDLWAHGINLGGEYRW